MGKLKYLFFIVVFVFFAAPFLTAEESTEPNIEPEKKPMALEKVERSFGARWFSMKGYKDFFEPRVAFIKRKSSFSEVIEYCWRPLVIYDMPHKERIDRIQFSFNRYYYSGKEKKLFYGAGAGGNVILFSQKLKDWGKKFADLDLHDGVAGLCRVFLGYKLSEFKLGRTVYPIVFRVDGYFSPPYKFGAVLGHAGEELKLTEINAGISFSIE